MQQEKVAEGREGVEMKSRLIVKVAILHHRFEDHMSNTLCIWPYQY